MRPRTILLATDLSPRCDRALDRAVGLASAWQAKVIVLHALTGPMRIGTGSSLVQPAEPRKAAARRIERDLRGGEGLDLDIVVERGEAVPLILEAVARFGVGLIVTGVAGAQTLGRALLGSTVEKLTRNSPVPVLVVKSRPRGPYANAIVASDFSEGSRCAMLRAMELFPEARLILFHAFDVPFDGMLEDRSAARESAAEAARAEGRAFLFATPGVEGRSISQVCEFGDVGTRLSDLADQSGADLVAVGTQGRSGVSGMLLGSVAHRVLAEVQTDVLVVRR